MNTNLSARILPLVAACASAAVAQQYTAVDLTPNASNGAMGFAVSGAAGGSVMSLGPLSAYVQHGAQFAGGNTNDIHPASWYMSVVLGMSGNQQAGLGLPTAGADASAGTHAVLWYGSAASFVDLHPNALTGSAATCT